MTEKDKKDLKKIDQEQMLAKLKKYLSHPGHRMPVTRRDFLAAGLINFSAAMTLPTIGQLLMRNNIANGAELDCPSTGGGGDDGLPGIITVNPSGGMSIQSTMVGMDAENGGLLPSYGKMGMGTVPGIIKKYGTNWYDKSQFGLSFINGTSSIDESKIRVLQIIGRTNSDSSGNAFDISGMAAAAGSIGEMLPNLGQSDTATGIKAVPARTLPPNPLVVRRFDDVVRALDIQGALANFTVAQKEALLRTINRLNDRQIASINNAAGAEQMSQLLQCAGIQNIEIVKQGAAGVDPRVDAKMQAIWGINAGTATNNDSVIRAAMVYNTLQKNAGTSGLTRGGYDYHGSSIAQQDAKDAVIGQDCAKIVQSAAALGKDVAVFICTDGSCSHPSSATRTGPTGDNNNSTQVLIMYKNDGAFTTKAPQIGQWSASQGVDLNAGTGPGDNQVMLAQIVMANILKMAKKDNMISAITGLSPTNPNIKVQA